jgi:hypothetical protein
MRNEEETNIKIRDRKILRRIHFLEIYTVLTTLTITAFIIFSFNNDKNQFDTIDVHRINVVEKDGQLIAVISNSDKMPDPIINGKAFKTERTPGMIFYNGLGDECGGLIFGALEGKDKYGAYGGFTLDQYKQSQTIGLVYNDHNGNQEAALKIWDRPKSSLIEQLQKEETISKLSDGPAKDLEIEKLKPLKFSPMRVFIGKNKEKEAKVSLYDANGKLRINMVIDGDGIPHLDFLDDTGKVTYSIPK